MTNTKHHFAPAYFLNPTHPITITVIGCGGTGSQIITALARIHHSLQALGHPGFMVHAYDNDIISESNIGRQMFSPADIGLNKASVCISRINRFLGLNWESHSILYDHQHQSNIIISAVDSYDARIGIHMLMMTRTKTINQQPHEKMFYWIDFGNTKSTGQVIFGTIDKIKQPSSKFETVEALPVFTDLYSKSDVDSIDDDGPSCSIAQSLNKQDLFINSTLANIGCDLIWKLFKNGQIEFRGCFLNMSSFKLNPIHI